MSHAVAADVITMLPDDLEAQLVHMQDEIIALQIKVAALEQLVLNEVQRAEYEEILKEQAERMLKLRKPGSDEKTN
jgi:sulfite reductase beta subunit-like hemoprotein